MKSNYLAKRNWIFEIQTLSMTNDMAKKYDDVIDLSIGDPDYPCDPKILRAMYEAGINGHTHYTEFSGDEELRQVICNQYNQYGSKYDIDNVIITAGGTHAMYLVMSAILDEGDEVIVISPYYIYYRPQIIMNKGVVVEYKSNPDENFSIDMSQLENLITCRTKAIIVNNPNNPTGKVYKEREIRDLIEIIKKYDIILIADDIYGALNYTEYKKPICTYECDPRILTIYSFSKDFSFTGLRLGYVIGGEKRIIMAIQNINEAINFTINSMAQRSGIYALEYAKEIQEPLREEYKNRLDYCYERIQGIKRMKCYKPEGTFYLFIDIRETGIKSYDLWHKILDEAHVLVLPGSGFGEAGEGFIRIACTVGVEKLKEAFDRLERMELFS
ncbi:MAG: aminotransferase class I/II-fold pyridoxal phosphate-dependent enzyme [Peptostreptococcaceae bacterium]|nr:aminotransferase class I/II-fold pyridoxal phosphate-dependent enzyme [Peptostreptococcaceae bacterium]